LAVAVDNGEGCAIDTLVNARIFNIGAANALEVLIRRISKAMLRF